MSAARPSRTRRGRRRGRSGSQAPPWARPRRCRPRGERVALGVDHPASSGPARPPLGRRSPGAPRGLRRGHRARLRRSRAGTSAPRPSRCRRGRARRTRASSCSYFAIRPGPSGGREVETRAAHGCAPYSARFALATAAHPRAPVRRPRRSAASPGRRVEHQVEQLGLARARTCRATWRHAEPLGHRAHGHRVQTVGVGDAIAASTTSSTCRGHGPRCGGLRLPPQQRERACQIHNLSSVRSGNITASAISLNVAILRPRPCSSGTTSGSRRRCPPTASFPCRAQRGLQSDLPAHRLSCSSLPAPRAGLTVCSSRSSWSTSTASMSGMQRDGWRLPRRSRPSRGASASSRSPTERGRHSARPVGGRCRNLGDWRTPGRWEDPDVGHAVPEFRCGFADHAEGVGVRERPSRRPATCRGRGAVHLVFRSRSRICCAPATTAMTSSRPACCTTGSRTLMAVYEDLEERFGRACYRARRAVSRTALEVAVTPYSRRGDQAPPSATPTRRRSSCTPPRRSRRRASCGSSWCAGGASRRHPSACTIHSGHRLCC